MENKNIQFKNATIDDIKALLDIEQRCFTKYYKAHRFTQQQFVYYIRNPLAITFIATQNGHVIGYVLGLTQRGRLRHIARLYSIATLPGTRRTGVSRHLLSLFLKSAKKRGAKQVILEVAEKNTAARKLFTLSGFHETDTMLDYYGKGTSGIRMAQYLGRAK